MVRLVCVPRAPLRNPSSAGKDVGGDSIISLPGQKSHMHKSRRPLPRAWRDFRHITLRPRQPQPLRFLERAFGGLGPLFDLATSVLSVPRTCRKDSFSPATGIRSRGDAVGSIMQDMTQDWKPCIMRVE